LSESASVSLSPISVPEPDGFELSYGKHDTHDMAAFRADTCDR
jgi:hypothetical protein